MYWRGAYSLNLDLDAVKSEPATNIVRIGKWIRSSGRYLEMAAWYLGASGLALGHTVIAQLMLLPFAFHDLLASRRNYRLGSRGFQPFSRLDPLSILAIWMLFSSIFAYKRDNAFGSTFGLILTGWISLWAVNKIFYHDSQENGNAKAGPRILTAFLAGSAIGALYALWRFIPNMMMNRWYIRAELPFAGCNAAGTLFALAILLASGCMSKARTPQKLGLGILILLEFLALMATQSRGALLALAAGLVIQAARNKRFAVIIAILAGMLALSVAFYPPLKGRYLPLINPGSSFKDRIEIWRTAAMMIRDNPLVGIGVNNFRSIYVKYPHPEFMHDPQPFAHNILLEMGASTGLPGLALFLWVIAAGLINGVKAAKSARHSHQGWVGIVLFIALLVHLQVDIVVYSIDMAPLFFIIYGALREMAAAG